MDSNNMNFDNLVQQIEVTDRALQNNARLVINRHVTAKAWLTGYYIVEYEQRGHDRAQYGERLLQNLAHTLRNKRTFSYRSLKLYKQFYLTYRSLASQIEMFVHSQLQIGQTVSAQLLCSEVGEEMAEYTMMGTDANLFLSKYQLELPSTEHITQFLREENKGLNKKLNKEEQL